MIKVDSLQFSYSNKPFIQGMGFEVRDGEIFGFLGPSGAGKSTVQKILTGLITRYQGSVTVDGVEVKRRSRNYYQNIGVDFEFPSLYEKLTARENLQFFSSLYEKKTDMEQHLKNVGLIADADKKVSAFSKGMKSRLNFIKALLHDPKYLFFDEPTSGLDPTNARQMKDIILKEKAKGKTILLTTHNMYDATELCDRVAFIVEGGIKALDTPHQLIMQKGAATIQYTYDEGGHEHTSQTLLKSTGEDKLLLQLLKENRLSSIHSSEPTLNDLFVELTGRELM